MKIKNNKKKNLVVSVVALAFTVGLFFGVFLVDYGYVKKIKPMQDELTLAQENIYQYRELCEALEAQLQYEYEVNEYLEMDLAEANATVANLKSEEYEIIYMGDFKITYYCDERESHICGGNGITASGEETVVGITAAADWSILPQGSKVYIEGVGFREIQDVGGAVEGNHIDVLVETHDDALLRGTHNEGIWLFVEKHS